MSVKTIIASAALLAVSSANGAFAASGEKCDLIAVKTASIEYKIQRIQALTDAYSGKIMPDSVASEQSLSYDKAVVAGLSGCKPGESIYIPSEFTGRFCDLGRAVIPQADNEVLCAKR